MVNRGVYAACFSKSQTGSRSRNLCSNFDKDAAVGETCAPYGFAHHRSQVKDPVGTVLSTEFPTDNHHNTVHHRVERSLFCVEGRGRIPRSGLTQDIKMVTCVFHCDVPHQWIAQRQVSPVTCLYTVTGWGVVSCVCGMTFLCGSALVKVPLLQVGLGIAVICNRCLKATLTEQTNTWGFLVVDVGFLC